MPENSRIQQRLSLAGTIFIERVSSGVEEDQTSEVILCKTIDISHSGLMVWVNQHLTVGAILQIGVELPRKENTLYLTGEVKWCRRDRYIDGRWRVGFALLDASDSDIGNWRSLVTEMEKESR